MTCRIYPFGSRGNYRYVVALSFFQGKIVLSRHRQRHTWETQGGHVEAGETPEQAARRELWEESGAVDYALCPLCDYWAGDEKSGAWGQVFLAEIAGFDPMPKSEMAEIGCFDQLPDCLTYPDITPVLFAEAERRKVTWK